MIRPPNVPQTPGKFRKRDAQRISNVVTAFEKGRRNQKPIKFRRPTGGGGAVRLGKINAQWDKGDEATVTQLNGDGSDIDGNPTFNAKNFFATIPVEDGTEKKVACGRVGDTWILIAAEC